VLTNEQLRLQNNLKLEDLSKAMNALWRTNGAGISITKDEDKIILGAFEGFCFGANRKDIKPTNVQKRRAE
jgi:hypothetical protein